MASEIKVDTISEKTSANGVSIDSVVHKDSAVYPSSADGGALGSASNEWSDLFLADSSVIKFGADQDTTLTHTDGTGLTLNSTNKLCFNDASQFIQGASATVLDIAATDEIELTATEVEMNVTTLDVNGNVDVSGTTLLPTLGVITAKDLGAGIHIRASDTGNSLHSVADEFCIEKTGGHTGMTILTDNDQNGYLIFADDNSSAGQIFHQHSSNTLTFDLAQDGTLAFNDNQNDVDFRVESSGNTHGLFLDAGSGELAVAESAPDVTGGGLTLQQASEDALILSGKCTDVAHPFTGDTEADTYFAVSKMSATEGGARVRGWSEGQQYGLVLNGELGNASPLTGEATNQPGGVATVCHKTNGSTSYAALGADENAFSVGNQTNVQFIVKGDGEIFSNQSATVGTYDEYDDAQLVRAYDLSRGKEMKGLINSKFDKFVKYNKKDLMDARLIGRVQDEKGDYQPTSFVSLTGMSRLHNGAIWQQYEKHNRLLDAVYDLAKEAVGEDKANAILDKHEVKRLQ